MYIYLHNIILLVHCNLYCTLHIVTFYRLAAQIDYADRLRNSQQDSRQMEALLEERIQLLQDRMKAITAQREQIEQANRGLEEELNKSVECVPVYIYIYYI